MFSKFNVLKFPSKQTADLTTLSFSIYRFNSSAALYLNSWMALKLQILAVTIIEILFVYIQWKYQQFISRGSKKVITINMPL